VQVGTISAECVSILQIYVCLYDILGLPDKYPMVQHLNIEINQNHMANILERCLAPMPSLVDLHLDSSKFKYENTPSLQFPTALFAGETPQLERVYLQNCIPTQWNCSLFHGLTELAIVDISEVNHPTFDALSELLSLTPQSRYLNLNNATHPQDLTDKMSSTSVYLPHLELLTLSGGVTAVYGMLSIILWPLQTKLRLKSDLSNLPIVPEHVSALVLLVKSHHDRTSTKGPQFLSTQHSGWA
jgi:hypothetical protein